MHSYTKLIQEKFKKIFDFILVNINITQMQKQLGKRLRLCMSCGRVSSKPEMYHQSTVERCQYLQSLTDSCYDPLTNIKMKLARHEIATSSVPWLEIWVVLMMLGIGAGFLGLKRKLEATLRKGPGIYRKSTDLRTARSSSLSNSRKRSNSLQGTIQL